jgi:hypothetical protein
MGWVRQKRRFETTRNASTTFIAFEAMASQKMPLAYMGAAASNEAQSCV